MTEDVVYESSFDDSVRVAGGSFILMVICVVFGLRRSSGAALIGVFGSMVGSFVLGALHYYRAEGRKGVVWTPRPEQ